MLRKILYASAITAATCGAVWAGGYGTSSNDGGRPMESISLNFAGITLNGIDRKPNKRPDEPEKPIQLAGLTATAID
jgi:hypothetical protein